MTDKVDYRKMSMGDWSVGAHEEATLTVLYSIDDRLEQLVGMAKPAGAVITNRLVHNHGPDEGRGLDCPERKTEYGLKGACLAPPAPSDVDPDEALAKALCSAFWGGQVMPNPDNESWLAVVRAAREHIANEPDVALANAMHTIGVYEDRAEKAERLLREIIEDVEAQAARCERVDLSGCEHTIHTLRRILESNRKRAES